ncbi:MAG: EAL domain-containing protein [Candidatus Nitrotoga sp.]
MKKDIGSLFELREEISSALEKNQFHLFYQIQVDNLNRPIGAEILIHWLHPEHGLLLPALFIPLAEELGLIMPIQLWLLEMACAQIKAWEQTPLTHDLVLAVNVSFVHFCHAGFVTQVHQIVQRYAIQPTQLKLEISESMLSGYGKETVEIMRAAKNIGIQLALANFGIGYSAWSYLKRYPLDQLKIDRSLVRDLALDNEGLAIVSSIINITKRLNIDVIAEGVETEVQRELLMNHGCNKFQGYLFGQPKPLIEFEQLLKLGTEQRGDILVRWSKDN